MVVALFRVNLLIWAVMFGSWRSGERSGSRALDIAGSVGSALGLVASILLVASASRWVRKYAEVPATPIPPRVPDRLADRLVVRSGPGWTRADVLVTGAAVLVGGWLWFLGGLPPLSESYSLVTVAAIVLFVPARNLWRRVAPPVLVLDRDGLRYQRKRYAWADLDGVTGTRRADGIQWFRLDADTSVDIPHPDVAVEDIIGYAWLARRGRTDSVTVREMTKTEPDFPAWCALLAEHLRADTGSDVSAESVADRIRAEPLDRDARRWAAFDGPHLVGMALSTPDSEGHRFIRVYVPPQFRGHGFGSALVAELRADHPAQRLKAVVSGDGCADAETLAQLAVLELEMSTVDGEPAEGLMFWHDGAPEDLVDSYAAAYRHLADALDSTEQIVDPHWDRARIRRWEADIRAAGHELWVCAAVTDGTVEGFSEIEVGDGPAASQHATVVRPEFRRTGLGTAVKLGLARRLRTERPHVATVSTTVNEANRPMLELNRVAGYRRVRTRKLIRLP